MKSFAYAPWCGAAQGERVLTHSGQEKRREGTDCLARLSTSEVYPAIVIIMTFFSCVFNVFVFCVVASRALYVKIFEANSQG